MHTMKLIAGLGNEGPQYSLTRHNVGFMVLDEFARQKGITFRAQARCHGRLAKLAISGGGQLILLKPSLYVNNSGRSVQETARYYRAPSHEVLIVQDDIDLPFGKIRIRQGGSSGGHKGIASINDLMEDFWRIKIGIADPLGLKADTKDYVLSPFSSMQMKTLPAVVKQAVSLLDRFARETLQPQTSEVA